MAEQPDSELFSGVDHAWLRMEEPTNRMVVHGLLIFDDEVDVDALRAKLAEDLEPFPRFRQKVTDRGRSVGRPHWEIDETFSYERHVVEHELPEPADRATLQAFTGDLMGEGLSFDEPLWRMHVINNYEGGAAVAVQIHHAIADGFALVYLMLALADDPSEVDLPIGEPPVLPEELEELDPEHEGHDAWRLALDFAAALVDQSVQTFNDPDRAVDAARISGKAAAALGRLLTLSDEPDTCLTGELTTDKLAAWSKGVPLAPLKDVAREYGGTLNDVLLTALTGAIRRYLREHDEEVAGLDLRSIVPVNLRPLDERTAELGNKFGLVFLTLPVNIDDPEARMWELKRRMDELKHSPEAYVTYATLRTLGTMPDEAQDAFVSLFRNKATFIITNMPGPTNRVPFAGQYIDDIMFWVPQSQGVGVGLSIFSYNGKVRIGVAGDASLLPDPHTFIDAFDDELAFLVG